MSILFFLVAAVMILASIGVVLMRNPLHSALCLILTMIGVAVNFAMLDAHFLSVVQLIVYAGAIMVLVIFVLMLLQSKEVVYKQHSLTASALGLFGGIGFLYMIVPVLQAGVSEVTKGAAREGTTEAIGGLLFTKYVFTFEIASLLIMAALVGAVMVGSRSIHKRKEVKA